MRERAEPQLPHASPHRTGCLTQTPCVRTAQRCSASPNPWTNSWNVGGTDNELYVVSSMGGGPFVATVTLGACTETDTAHVTWWPTPLWEATPTA